MGIAIRSEVRLDSVASGILVAPVAGNLDGSAVRRVVSSGQVVIPRKFLADHGIEDDGRVYVARTDSEPASLIIVPENQVTGPFFTGWPVTAKGTSVDS